jgi:hypothetical protein
LNIHKRIKKKFIFLIMYKSGDYLGFILYTCCVFSVIGMVIYFIKNYKIKKRNNRLVFPMEQIKSIEPNIMNEPNEHIGHEPVNNILFTNPMHVGYHKTVLII